MSAGIQPAVHALRGGSGISKAGTGRKMGCGRSAGAVLHCMDCGSHRKNYSDPIECSIRHILGVERRFLLTCREN